MESGGGGNNASTAADRTNYYSEGPSSLLPTLLWLDADRLEGLGKAMTQEKLDLQRSVVLNERRQNTENAQARSGAYAWDGLLIVLVGDKAAILPQLEKAGFPKPVFADAEGNIQHETKQ